ncbi:MULTISPECIES: SNF2-related protein [unclassified Paenibacillus]|uniref:DEAD/DEAH box helicase n=1 Tax=unclassified Paenibacillus TaxID=185978 RepID=UPI001AE97826|nr:MULTISPECIES: SNF2-related protein [unclassified Paenibacillus]MBP1154828.1 SNF2 family DNA or RNA helicase [Paenibacillus sp. PvP091]MBP1169788.1 SNF2 family DNA or RNA helicase [Paenibacillus sp. PvR098]MBP2440816.1 SNF2 family DNA or RNA helicase [Paenibacillus sp. PvP052]
MQSTERKEHVRQLNEHVELHYDREWFEKLHERALRNGPWDDPMMFRLAYEAEQSGLIRSFDELLCLTHLPGLVPMEHQISTAKKVLTEMRGRAILADEVGLGKTIEAGLILKEYMIRGLIQKVLILVPASLVLQWVRELNQKFGIPAVAQKKEYMWVQNDIVVASMDTAKRDPHRDIVLGLEYDMLIVDEAHKLKNKKTTNYRFINELRKKYCLLLTATPVQNDLKELYNLITLLKPGQLGGQGSFQANFVVDKRIPKNEEQLQQELSKVMIRNRRSDGGISFTKRVVRNIPLQLSDEEQALYDGVTDFVKTRYDEAGGDIGSLLSLVTLQREVCSSRDAVFITLVNMFKKTEETSPLRARIWELVEKIRGIKANTKAEKVMELIESINDKTIIFTEYRASQEYLLQYLKEHKISAVPYRGGMNRGKKDWMMDLFRGRAQVLIATEAGGEGINLQFCHHMINFDLPWNPMRVEQRIGRVHRLGQKEDVKIYNLSTIGTIEEHILSLLHEKINMFELVIGQLDTILERFEKKTSLESHLAKLILTSKNKDEIRQQLDDLGRSFTSVKAEVEQESHEAAGLENLLNNSLQTIGGKDYSGGEVQHH